METIGRIRSPPNARPSPHSTDHLQLAYKVECTRCGFVYDANGSDLFERTCQECQGGAPGVRFWQVP